MPDHRSHGEEKVMTARFEGRVALVTGSSKGIGRATATRLAREGAAVVLNARHPEELEATRLELAAEGLEVTSVEGNVGRLGGPEAIVEAAVATFGRIDLVVNTVAVNTSYGPLLELEHDAFSVTMVRNTWPTIALAQAAIAHGLGEGGAIVAVSTIGSHSVQPLVAPYCASKSALDTIVRSLARELGPRGIRVNAVAPGLIVTDMSRALWEGEQADREAELLPLGRLGQPEDIAGAITWLLSGDSGWVTGQIIDVDGGRLLVGDEPAHLIGVHASVA
jgi:NAD(P)-dependent dehydrogenase (short-subunit alcohol dehydrogenase family)